MTDVYDKLLACEQAEKKGQAYPFFPEIWGEARQELERLRGRLARIATTPEDNPDHLRWLASDALRNLTLGEGRE
jgi:hypothetical protein